ncbi:UNVERIFIED_CONTAM: hypothetical protein Slati_2257100 [Sesamum latifolium]|uniref:Retroviral aspartyl protease n=1 Tax=Sesamum latifolium TaxID=2727402 RepID=A0AAW2WUG2_9LAMI
MAELDIILPPDDPNPTSPPQSVPYPPQVPLCNETSLPLYQHFQLSLGAISGSLAPRTLYVGATIKGLPITVLIDSGNLHNILKPRVAHRFQLPIYTIPSFVVIVGNDASLYCFGAYEAVSCVIEHHTFTIPFYLIPIQGADVVLGVQWLQYLGPFISDFSIPYMQFHHHGSVINIKGDKSIITPTTFHLLCRLLSTDSISSLHAITMIHIDGPSTPSTNIQTTLSPTDPTTISVFPADLVNFSNIMKQFFPLLILCHWPAHMIII